MIQEETLRREETDCSCPKILVADDDIFNLFTMESLMKGFGLKIVKANNGQEAVNIVKERAENKCSDGCRMFRLILMDLSMPVMDGFQATIELKKMMASREIAYIPIIACTAFVGADKTERCFECGMEGKITKPVSKTKISKILETYHLIHSDHE